MMKKLWIALFVLGVTNVDARYDAKESKCDGLGDFEIIEIPSTPRASQKAETLDEWFIVDEDDKHSGMSPSEVAAWEMSRQKNKVTDHISDKMNKELEKGADQAGDYLNDNIDSWFESAKAWIAGWFSSN